MDRNVLLIRKILFFLFWYLGYYSICFYLFIPSIFQNGLFFSGVVIYYAISFLDTILRPFPEDGLSSRHAKIMLVLFIVNPFLIISSRYEYLVLLKTIFPKWNGVITTYIGILLLNIGGIITLSSRFKLGRYSGGILRIHKYHKLIKTGLYGVVRHPIYLGGLISAFGLILIFRGLLTSLLVVIIYFFVFRERIEHEESILEEEFEEEYREYKKETWRLLPYIY